MKIEPTNLLKALKEKPSQEAAKDVSIEEKVELANELHEWLNDRGAATRKGQPLAIASMFSVNGFQLICREARQERGLTRKPDGLR